MVTIESNAQNYSESYSKCIPCFYHGYGHAVWPRVPELVVISKLLLTLCMCGGAVVLALSTFSSYWHSLNAATAMEQKFDLAVSRSVIS